MAYVDREAVLDALCETDCGVKKRTGICNGCNFAKGIAQIPAADVAPVVHGHWIEQHFGTIIPVEYDGCGDVIVHDCVNYRCSLCGRIEGKKEPYCNCGARMDGAE